MYPRISPKRYPRVDDHRMTVVKHSPLNTWFAVLMVLHLLAAWAVDRECTGCILACILGYSKMEYILGYIVGCVLGYILGMYPRIYLRMYPRICPKIYLRIYPRIYLRNYLRMYLRMCPRIYLRIYPGIYLRMCAVSCLYPKDASWDMSQEIS